MRNELIIAALIAFFISIVLGPVILPILRKIKAGQTEREDGPESHLKKTGTPTMGAFIYLISAFVLCAFKIKSYPEMVPTLLLTVGFMLIGFLDDFIKVVLKRSLGLRAWQKFSLQILFALVYALYIKANSPELFDMVIPFTQRTVNFGWLSIPAVIFIIVGTVNGSNFTDGVDGLETSVTSALLAFFIFASMGTSESVGMISSIFLGALLGFLMFNVNKAKVFMGDTGSLALGALVCGLAFSLKLPLYLPVIALIYFAEVLSVIMQVLYFKATKGKRIFKMTPIHHHFELSGWSEPKVVAVFATVTLVLGAFVLLFI